MRDRAPAYIALADLLLCCLSVIIVAVAPHSHAKGPEQKAEYLVSADWPTEGPVSDADVDLWLETPHSQKPVMYSNRVEGCATLDRDSMGWITSRVTMPDGTVKIVDSQKETVVIRCIEQGRYNVGIHLYAFHRHEGSPVEGDYGLKVHVKIVKLNPFLHTEWVGDVVLDRDWQFTNTVSFDLSADGKLTLADTPVEPFANKFFRR